MEDIASICSSVMFAIILPIFFTMSGLLRIASRALASAAGSTAGGAFEPTSGGRSSSDSSAAALATAAEASPAAEETSTPAAMAVARASASAAATLASSGASAAARDRSATASARAPALSLAEPLRGAESRARRVSQRRRIKHTQRHRPRCAPAVIALQRPLVHGDDGAGFGLGLGGSSQLQQAVRQVEHADLAQLPPCATGRTSNARCGVSSSRAPRTRDACARACTRRVRLQVCFCAPVLLLRLLELAVPVRAAAGGFSDRTQPHALTTLHAPRRRLRERSSGQTHLTSALPCVFSISDACVG